MELKTPKFDYSDIHWQENGKLKLIIVVGTRPEIIRLAAILGLAEGQDIEWPQPDGHIMKVRIEKVIYQPEREGNYL